MATRKIEVAITGDASSLERAFRRSGNAADTFGSRLGGKLGKGMKIAGLAAGGTLVAGLGLAAVGLAKAGKAAAEAEASNARLSAQLKTLGKNTTAIKGNIDKTVQSLSMMSGFDDEDLQDSFTTLVRTTGNVKKAQGELNLVADVARGRQISLASAANIVNRVNAGNVGSLKKLGIEVDKSTTKEQALAMLRAKFAGQAKAYGETAAGAQERLGVAMENAFEQVGVALTPLIAEFANFATGVLPGIAASISKYLGTAIAWIKTNWPQIKPVLVGIFEAVSAVVVPTVRAIVTGIGAAIGFIKLHMPEIRAATQAAFGWITTNLVPSVRAVAGAVANIVRFMAGVWHEHGEDIKRIVGPAFNAVKTIVSNALTIVKGVIEVVLAVIRGDWGKAWSSLKTIASAAISTLTTMLLLMPRTILAVAKIVGRELVEGIKQGFEAAAGGLKSFLEQKIHSIVSGLNPFSPVAHGGEVYIGRELIRGAAEGARKGAPHLTKSLTAAVRQSVRDARGNLGSLTSGLAGLLGDRFAQKSPEAKRLATIRAQQAKENDVRRRAELQAAIDSAETDDERAKAQQDLNDYLLDYEAQQLEASISAKQESYNKDIANLTASFNAGKLSAADFRDALKDMIGGDAGADLGASFAAEFAAQINAVFAQVAALGDYGSVVGATGPEVSRVKKPKGKGKGKKPKKMAMGGILTHSILAGEAGPEAVLPLSSGRARTMLASAIRGANGARGGGGTVVNVTVAGNEFSARDFARKLQPELNRLVGFGTV